MPLYTSTGSINVVTDDTTKGRYSPTGALRINLVSGTSYTGLYAADGALNVVDVSGVSISTYGGLYHPCGALRGRTAPDTYSGLQAPDGSYYLYGLSQPFTPAELFALGEVGAWYDPSDLTTLFQDAAGTTPLTAVEQPVGLVLDKSKNGVGTNGAYKINRLFYTEDLSNAYWTKQNATVTGTATIADTAASAFHFVETSTFLTITSGVVYQFRVRLEKGTGQYGGIHYTDGTPRGCSIDLDTGTLGTPYGGASATRVADGSGWILTITATAGATTASGNIAVYISNSNALASYVGTGKTITASKLDFRLASEASTLPTYQPITSNWSATLPGSHLSQSTAAARPVLSSRVNLLTYTEQFDNAYWTKTASTITANAVTAPDGSLTADKLVETATTGAHTVSVDRGTGTAISGTASIYLKAGERTKARLTSQDSNYKVDIDLSNGTLIGSNGSAVDGYTITDAGNGWWRLSVTETSGLAWRYFYVQILDAANALSYTGDGTSGIYIWGADLRPTNAGVGLPAYQRVGAATDYDTTGFPLYLAFDGTDDGLSSASIDFSATDKMAVFAGVRKLSDAAPGMLVELSSSGATNNGTFTLLSSSAGADYFFRSRGTGAITGATASPYIAPITDILTGLGDISGDSMRLRVDAMQVAANFEDQGTGNFGNYALHVGRRFNNPPTTPSSNHFFGHLYSLIVRGAATDAATITATETWVNQRTKAF